MGPAVGLEVEAHDLDRANLLDAFGQEVHLRPDQVGDRKRLLAREHVDADVARSKELLVDRRFDGTDELAGHALELEVHPPAPGFHVAARHERAVVAPDDPAQRVERRVRPHQAEPAVPVQVGGEQRERVQLTGADRRGLRAGLQLVPDLVALPAHSDDLPGPAIGGPKCAAVRGLSPATGVEDRPVQEHERALPLGRGRLHGTQASLDAPGVRIDVADVLAHRRTPSRGRARAT